MKKSYTTLVIFLLSSGISFAQFTWTQKQNAPDNRYEGVGFAAGDKIYYGLGFNTSLGAADNKFYVYDPVLDAWDTIASFPGTPRRMASAFSVGGKGYVGFGVDPATTLQLSDLWEYDPGQNNWTSRTGLPAASGWLAGTATSTATKGYAGCGLHDHTSGFLNLKWWEYDPVSDTWMQKSDIPGFGLYQPSSFTIGDSIYIVCGIGSSLLVPTREVWLFDIQANTWTQLPDFPGNSRSLVSAFAINGTGYAGYGLGNGASDLFNDFYSYNPTTGSWTSEPFCATALFDVACANSTSGFVINNISWNSASPDVWEFSSANTGVLSAPANENYFEVTPNPSNGNIKINTTDFNSLSVYSIDGKQIMAYAPEDISGNQINLSSLECGIYYLIAERKGDIQRERIAIVK